jgi:geranylgeranyl diphosphate synthase type II
MRTQAGSELQTIRLSSDSKIRQFIELACARINRYALPMFDLTTYLRERKAKVDFFLDQKMPSASTRPTILHEAMRYSVFGEAKRIRPILCMAAAEACGGDANAGLLPGAAIELLHTYTLIHDDLPAMDDDTLRRGRPTCHVRFGEANAILAGDALLTLAFEWLAETTAPPPHPPTALARELATAAGSKGLIAGQVEDIDAEGKPPDPDRLEYIHMHKTADLLRAAARMGAIAAGASHEFVDDMGRYGECVGLAFQIADDVLNATADFRSLGKSGGTDAARGKLTFVSVYGIDASRTRARALTESAKNVVRRLPGPVEPLIALADFVVERTA